MQAREEGFLEAPKNEFINKIKGVRGIEFNFWSFWGRGNFHRAFHSGPA